MSEAWHSARLKKISLIALKIYSVKHKNMPKIPSAPGKLLYPIMLDKLGFKVGFPKRTKVNRWRRGF